MDIEFYDEVLLNTITRIGSMYRDLTNTELPHNCRVELCVTNGLPNIIITVPPNGIVTGHIMVLVNSTPGVYLEDQMVTTDYATLSCSVDNFNGYFAEIVVQNMDELLQMVNMVCDTVQAQPQRQFLDAVVVPENWIQHRLVPERWADMLSEADTVAYQIDVDIYQFDLDIGTLIP
jgi:hypothetical protein